MQKNQALDICRIHGLAINYDNCTFASKLSKQYRTTPKTTMLRRNWTLILNDSTTNELHIFDIPANTLSAEKLTAHDGDKFVCSFAYGDATYRELESDICFNQWHRQTIRY